MQNHTDLINYDPILGTGATTSCTIAAVERSSHPPEHRIATPGNS